MNPTEININDFKDVSMSDIKKEDEHYSWRCCLGGSTDSRLIQFIAVYLILFMVFVFCLAMLALSKTCEDITGYLSLLSLLLGLLINPTSK